MSRDKKKQINLYQINDCEAIAGHLEKMAAKGWLLEKVGNWGWTFRRAEPCQVRYCITFFPGASVFDPGPTGDQETYIDYCAAAGWEFVSSYGPAQYFRSTRPDPVPIETDEAAKLRAIHRSMWKTLILGSLLLLFAQLINVPGRVRHFRWAPMSELSDSGTLGLWLMMAVLVVYLVGSLADYFIWYFRSKRSVERGGACLPVHTRARLWASGVLLAACAAGIAGFVSELTRPGFGWILLYSFGGMALLLAVIFGVMNRMKRQGSARGDTRAAYLVLTVVLAVAYSFGMVPFARHLSETGATERAPAYTYTKYGVERSIYLDELPVTLEELGFPVSAEDHCSYEAEVSRSPLARHTVCTQYALGEGSDLPDLEYQVCEIPWGWLRDLCWDTLVHSGDGQFRAEDVAVEPAPEAALSRARYGGRQYLLLFEDRIVVISGDWEMTAEQIRRAALPLLE
ncbi:MAG: DUF2812 domain-containing protein [Oscillospiraceae bacterium]|nr:DUF2812 domain-containing protein [Oscillospiraceae bacterium]